MALSKPNPTREITNFARMAKIILGPCTDVLRDVLREQITPLKIKQQHTVFFQKKYSHLMVDEGDIFESFVARDFSCLNIRMLYASLRCICSISPQKNRWDKFPDEQDRSLSANIERVYNKDMEYRHYPTDHLEDSVFEQEWKNIFQTIKEIEMHLGSGTKHQDTLQRLKTCPIDLEYKENSIVLLRGSTWLSRKRKSEIRVIEAIRVLTNLLLEEEEEYEDIKIIDSITQSEMEAEGIKTRKFGTKYQMQNFDTVNYRRKWELELEDSDSDMDSVNLQERTEPIASKELTELFNSFNVEFPDDPSNESFARIILQSRTLNLVTVINSLSREVVLTNDPDEFYSKSNKVLMSEIDVVYEGGEFRIVKKDTSPDRFNFCPTEFSHTMIILITSKFLPVVKAKLMVYEKYKHTINTGQLFLQHEYEEFDNVAKLFAAHHLKWFCTYIESIINAFTVDFYQIITAHVDRPLKGKDIEKMCLKAFNESLFDPYDLCDIEQKRNWDEWIAYKINRKLSGKGDFITTDAWHSIWNICRKTVEDLRVILSKVEEFRSKVIPPDQDKDIAEWHKIEVIRNKFLLREYPSIIKYIAGHNGDGKDKVKVYLSDDDEEAEQFFKKECRKVLKDPDFEFVIVGKTNEILEENEEMELLEEEDSSTDNLDWTQLTHAIQKCEKKIYARYSNVIGIQVGNVTGVDNPMQEDIGVILCCLDTTLIPFGENPLPEYIEGWPCGFKEDFFMFGACPKMCTSTDPNLPKPGCSIGIPSDSFCGSTGFLYKSNSNEDESGFLTASHVAIKNFKDLYLEGKPLSDHRLGRQKHFIVHPSFRENNSTNNRVGEVVESYFGDYGDPPTGLDFAVVRCNFPRQKEMEALTVVKKTELNFKNTINVKKTGRTTETTYGYLIDFKQHRIVSARIFLIPDSDEYYEFQMPYVVRDKYKKKAFFEKGDSGSGVFVLGERNLPEKALGIAFGYSYEKPYTFVCNIDEILTKLNLELVKYPQDAWVWCMED